MAENTETPKDINEAYLEKFKYHELKEELEKLGVNKAFKPGKTKEAIIKEAISQLAILKNLKKEGAEGTEKQLEKIRAKQIEEAKEKEKEVKKITESKKEKSLSNLKKKKFSLDILKRNLQVIDANLINGKGEQRLILLKKREEIVALIEEAN